MIFRFRFPKESSLYGLLKADPSFISTLALPERVIQQGITPKTELEFPLMEFTSKLESIDRRVSFTEAISSTQ